MDISNFTDLRTLGMNSLKMSSLQIDRMLPCTGSSAI